MISRVTLAAAALAAIVVFAGCGGGQILDKVVVYTSVDQPHSEPVLKAFEAKTGIRVEAVYDVEAAKTTGLVSRLAAEAGKPRADVFWSGEFAQTVRLKKDRLLEQYDSPSAAAVPAAYRDRDHYWTGFAARTRVLLVNTNLVPLGREPRSMSGLLDPAFGEGEVGIANPLFGTTATHAAALFAKLGPDKAQAYFRQLRQRKVRVVDGNSVVRDMVVSGELKAGLTDTDDAHEAVAKGAAVAMIFPDQEGPDALGTLVIPNTAGLVRGAPNPSTAKRLLDFLFSTEVEAMLARSGSLQMPLRDGVATPPEVPQVAKLRAMDVSLEAAAEQFPIAAEWLKQEFLR